MSHMGMGKSVISSWDGGALVVVVLWLTQSGVPALVLHERLVGWTSGLMQEDCKLGSRSMDGRQEAKKGTDEQVSNPGV